MTESEWLASEDAAAMLEHFAGRAGSLGPGGTGWLPRINRPSDRKLRFFACACYRQVWRLLTDARSRQAVEVAERFADGGATAAELDVAEHSAHSSWQGSGNPSGAARYCCLANISHGVQRIVRPEIRDLPNPATQAALLRDIIGNPFRPIQRPYRTCRYCHGELAPLKKDTLPLLSVCRTCGRDGPFWVDVVKGDEPSWLRWQDGQVVRLVQAAYEERASEECVNCDGYGHRWYCRFCRGEWKGAFGKQVIGCVGCENREPLEKRDCKPCHSTGRIEDGILDPDRLAVLADALEEAGCTEEVILRHLRGWERCPKCYTLANEIAAHNARPHVIPNLWPTLCEHCDSDTWIPLRGPHVRGCWVLDLLTERE